MAALLSPGGRGKGSGEKVFLIERSREMKSYKMINKGRVIAISLEKRLKPYDRNDRE